jgi:ABC-type transport system involved in multi-copper enzyme maturation permease subunit
MRFKSSPLIRFIIIELEEYWSFPVFELVLFAGLISILKPGKPLIMVVDYREINSGIYGLGFLLLMLIIGLIIPRTFAGSLNRRETLVFLSYPVKRRTVLLGKFIANYLMFLLVLSTAVMLQIPLVGLSPLDAAPYALIITIAIQLLLLCSIAMFISVTLKNEIISVFMFLTFMFGIEFSPAILSTTYAYLTPVNSNNILYRGFTSLFYEGQVTSSQFSTALAFPLLATLILLIISLVYFEKVMQLD